MSSPFDIISGEFLKPMVQAWLTKQRQAREYRATWEEVARECLMFYARSAQAMYDPKYTKKFWKGVNAPKFRVTINKAFEYVAVHGPSLMWTYPHRDVKPKKTRDLIIPEYMQIDPNGEMLQQILMPQQQMTDIRDAQLAKLLSCWQNYTPREQPGGGLVLHSQRAVVDALITGRGILDVRPYKMPNSNRTLTGAFRLSPFTLFTDPDFDSLDEARWICLENTVPYFEAEEKFGLPAGSLKGKSTLESSWHFSEFSSVDGATSDRKAGKTNDLVTYYEFYSKCGCGAMLSGMESFIKDELEKTVGKYAYIAICPNVPYPLNCTSEDLRKGMSPEEVKAKFSWPIPTWADDRWPVEVLDFYLDPECSWPVAPLSPGLGELKLLNFLVSWLANRVWTSSRDFWAVAGPHVEHYRKYILEGDDQSIIPTPVTVDDVRKAVTILQQPETRQDMTKLIEFVSDMFDKRVNLTPFVYGQNDGGTQDRTAETTAARARAVGVRSEFMQNQVVAWQARVAELDAYVTRFFVTGDDVEPLVGPMGKYLWEQLVMSTDVELTLRQFSYTVDAASIRRPNRERDIANYQQIVALFLPVLQTYAQVSGDYQPVNGMMEKWAEFHDADLSGAMIPPKGEPTPEEQQMQAIQMQMAQAELEKTQAEAQNLNSQSDQEAMKLQMNAMQEQSKLEFDQIRSELNLRHDAAKFRQDMLQDEQKHAIDLKQSKEMAKAKVAMAKKAKPAGAAK